LTTNYTDVDWTFLQQVYGWSALQYQAWARGRFTVPGDSVQSYILYTDTVLEYWIDSFHYFGGDFYSYRRAPPVLSLSPGEHQIEVRFYRDVRAFGGVGNPTASITLQLNRTSGSLELSREGVLTSDMVNGQLASQWISVSLRNSGQDAVEVFDVADASAIADYSVSMAAPVILTPGQSRPINMRVQTTGSSMSMLDLAISFRERGRADGTSTLRVSQKLRQVSLHEPQKVTFLHPGGIVSYAILRPPSSSAICGSQSHFEAPILLSLHGAGVEADDNEWRRVFQPVPDICAWVLLATGSTSWSGDDWHNWGFADVEAAISSIPDWIRQNDWQGVGVHLERWLVSGHSNGGQGTWYAITHRPDKVIAASPISGYLSIQTYVPYNLWQDADPMRTAVLQASLNTYKHELLVENCQGIPLQQQHGGADDNVPTYHSRLMNQRLTLAGWPTPYNEVPGSPHYYDGVLTTDVLQGFYRKYLGRPANTSTNLDRFTLVVANPGDTGFKEGIKVTQLLDPGRYGSVAVSLDQSSCSYVLKTSNILEIEVQALRCLPTVLSVDGSQTTIGSRSVNSTFHVKKAADGIWQVGDAAEGIGDRKGRQLGGLLAILRTHGNFVVRYNNRDTYDQALQVSQNLHQYFSADTLLVSDDEYIDNHSGNLITVATGDAPKASAMPNFPIRPGSTGELRIRVPHGQDRLYQEEDGGSGLGAIYLRPLSKERLELVIWGADSDGTARAARLLPLITGVGQPDFVVLGEASSWKGVDGAVATGFLDHEWNVTKTSFFS